MSIFGAMYTGVAGLAANSQAMGMISDNITNVNTVGYKGTTARFSTLVTEPARENYYVPGGVRALAGAMVDRQGLLQSAEAPTDLAISGNGFFVVNTTTDPATTQADHLFTRAGSFRTDAGGYLRNTAGYYLMGWPIGTDGALPTNRTDLTALEPINVGRLTGTAEETTKVALTANLQASQPAYAGPYAPATFGIVTGDVTPHFERSVEIYDSQGGTRSLTFGYVKTGPNTWAAEVYADPADVDIAAHPSGLIASGTLAFDSDGTLAASPPTTLPRTLNITWAADSGLGTQSIAFDYGSAGRPNGFTQYDSPSTLISSTVDGAVFGSPTSVDVDQDGVVTAVFGNGVRRPIFKMPLATFRNPNGLEARPGNAYAPSNASGALSLLDAGTGGAGQVAANALEGSTVDLAEEFTNMITVQRAYSASSRIITTANEMLDDVMRIVS